jgi:type 1 fimbria pilin
MSQVLQRCFRQAVWRLLPVTVCAVGGLVTVSAQAAIDVAVSQTVTPANCDLALGGGDMAGGTVSFPSLQSADLSGVGRVSASQTFNLTLSNCGANAVTVAPHITVSGTPLGAGDDAWLFRDSGSATGMGFIFRFGGSTVDWDATSTTAKNMQPGDDITLGKNTNGAELPTDYATVPIPVAVAVSTGKQATQAAGDLAAAVTFTFEYR